MSLTRCMRSIKAGDIEEATHAAARSGGADPRDGAAGWRRHGLAQVRLGWRRRRRSWTSWTKACGSPIRAAEEGPAVSMPRSPDSSRAAHSVPCHPKLPGAQGWKLLLHTLLRRRAIGGTRGQRRPIASSKMARRQGLEDATGDQIKSTAATPYGACLGVLGAGSYPQPGSPPRYTHEHAKFRTQPCLLHPPTPHAQVLLHTFSPSKLRPSRRKHCARPARCSTKLPQCAAAPAARCRAARRCLWARWMLPVARKAASGRRRPPAGNISSALSASAYP